MISKRGFTNGKFGLYEILKLLLLRKTIFSKVLQLSTKLDKPNVPFALPATYKPNRQLQIRLFLPEKLLNNDINKHNY